MKSKKNKNKNQNAPVPDDVKQYQAKLIADGLRMQSDEEMAFDQEEDDSMFGDGSIFDENRVPEDPEQQAKIGLFKDETKDDLEWEEDTDEAEMNQNIKDTVEKDQFDIELIRSISADKDLKRQVVNLGTMSRREIKTVVDLFYQVQKDRIALQNQIRAIQQNYDEQSKDKNNTIVLEYLLKNMEIMETNTASIIEKIVEQDEVGRWLLQVVGIAATLAAGILAYFDVEGKNYATHFISYAGLNDNNRPWLGVEKAKAIVDEVLEGEKEITDDLVMDIAAKTQWSFQHIAKHAWNEEKGKWSKDKIIKACAMVPYNRNVKKLMYKVGSSFTYQCKKPTSLYGRLYAERKVLETKKNEDGEYADQAAKVLEEKNYGKETLAYKAYSAGKLPKAHIMARAMRYAEKIFLSHVFEEMYRVKNDQIPPRYYVLDHCDGHHDEIKPEIPYTKVSGEE